MTDPHEYSVGNVWGKTRGYRGVGCGWVALVVAVVVGLGLTIAVLSFALGWFNEGAKIVSPQNVKAQYQFAYDGINNLKSSARQVCVAEKAAAVESDPAAKIQRESQLLVIEENYSRIEASYDSQMADLFRAKIVRPRDVPARAPGLSDMKAEVC